MKYILFLLAFTFCAFLFAQDTANNSIDTNMFAPDTTVVVTDASNTIPTVEDWFTKGMPVIMGALTIIFGYLSKWIPVLNKIENTKYRVFAIAILLGAGFMFYGASIWQVFFAYAGSTSLYELGLKEVFGSSWHVQQKLSKNK